MQCVLGIKNDSPDLKQATQPSIKLQQLSCMHCCVVVLGMKNDSPDLKQATQPSIKIQQAQTNSRMAQKRPARAIEKTRSRQKLAS